MTNPRTAQGQSTLTFVLPFFLLVAAALAFSDRGQIAGDGLKRWQALVELAEHGRLTADRYSLVQPLLALPLYAAGATLAKLSESHDLHPESLHERRLLIARPFVQRFNKVIAFLLCVVCFRISRHLLQLTQRQAAGVVLFVMFGTLLIPHARDFYSECLWTLLSLILLFLFSGPPWASTGIAVTILLTLAIPLNPVLAPVFLLVLVFLVLTRADPAHRRLAMYGLSGLIFGVACLFLENLLRRGAFLRTGYEGEGFTTPFATGLVGQLMAPARGIVYFLPAYILGWPLASSKRLSLSASERQFVRLSLVYSAALLLVYSKWSAWHGGLYWGPRFLLPLSICGALYLALLIRHAWHVAAARVVGVGIIVASLLVCKVGLSVNQAHLSECVHTTSEQSTCYWSFAYSPLASFLSREDLRRMAMDRSTAVEGATLILFGLLCRPKPRGERAHARAA
jgi:hypothetical protein